MAPWWTGEPGDDACDDEQHPITELHWTTTSLWLPRGRGPASASHIANDRGDGIHSLEGGKREEKRKETSPARPRKSHLG